ncbi:MAG: type II toxin-antitoxin system HipA family toxin [Fibrobacter sp.]|nr:type II toxin-antitoxin system HipA family toxin [Fibrobacter sp.]
MKLKVYFANKLAGSLFSTPDRGIVFAYDDSYVGQNGNSLSMSLPLRSGEFSQKECLPFFSGVLPEGDVKRRISEYLHVSESSTLKLLQELGGECAGIISVLPEDAEPNQKLTYRLDSDNYEELSEDILLGYIKNAETRPLLKANEELRLSLAGAQEKLPLAFFDGKFHFPKNGAPSTHIIKPTGKGELSSLAVNEYVCVKLAKYSGLSVPEVALKKIQDETFIMVERYDRIKRGDSVVRLHQEDMCQALGILSDRKYQNDGGPGIADIFQLISQRTSVPLLDARAFIQYVLFNLVIGNCDAHGKNYSLLYDDDILKLSPIYDAVCTLLYPTLTRKVSMKIGNHYEIDKIRKADLVLLAEQLKLRQSVILNLYSDLRKKVLLGFSSIREDESLGGCAETIDEIEKIVQERDITNLA